MPKWGSLCVSWIGRFFVAVIDKWTNKPGVDLLLVLAILGLHLYLFRYFGVKAILPWSDSPQRLAVYAAGAGMASLIAGFAGAAIAVYASSSGATAVQIRKSFGSIIRKNWISILSWLLTSAFLCIFAMTIESKSSANYSQWLFEFSILIAIVKFGRLVLLFSLVMKSSDVDVSKNDDSIPRWKPMAVSSNENMSR